MARLRREIAEVKGEVERQKSQGSDKTKVVVVVDELWDIDALSEVLGTVDPTSGFEGRADGAAARLARQLDAASTNLQATTAKSPPKTQSSYPAQGADPTSTTYTFHYAPDYNPTHTLSKVTSFDTRLSTLESLLGIDTLPLPTQLHPPSKPLLPTLDTLSRQLTTLTTSTDTSLDTLSRRVRQLTTETQSLETARKAATKALATQQEEKASSTSELQTTAANKDTIPPETLTDPDNLAKIHALYGTLPIVDALAPLLPPTLDRLRSLRTLHAEAAQANQTLQGVEERQEGVKEEIQAWTAGLEEVERAVGEAAGRMKENAGVIEGWVRGLEGRVEKLNGGG